MNDPKLPTPKAVREFANCVRLLQERAKNLADSLGHIAAIHADQRLGDAADDLDLLADSLEGGQP